MNGFPSNYGAPISIVILVIVGAVLYLEAVLHLQRSAPLKSASQRIVGTYRASFLVYSLTTTLVLWGILIPQLLYNYSGMFLVGVISELHLPVVVFFLNRYKFGFFTLTEEHHNESYFDAIKEMPPTEGVDYIVRYILNPRWGVPKKHLESFLRHLAQRDDEYGKAAVQKLQELDFKV